MRPVVKALIGCLLTASVFIASGYDPAAAQTIIEMSALKCGDYLESPPDRQVQYAAWMSGYFNAMQNKPMVDLKRFATNKKLIEKYCRTHKKDVLMNVIRKVAI
jgi:acid stress chaperone HdeB